LVVSAIDIVTVVPPVGAGSANWIGSDADCENGTFNAAGRLINRSDTDVNSVPLL
jgi:hypothetical protein